jgi:hypothetical protein
MAPATLPMLTTAPPSARWRSASRHVRAIPATFTSHIASNCSSGMVAAGVSRTMPAQFTTAVTRPMRAAASTAARTLSFDVTSIGWSSTEPASASTASGVRSTATSPASTA